ncbi:hypothetical protein VSDG_02073 [Cytospora chrysosperma]|uniref:FHA domain-containing protein n=1 Tax=Cytospora chrysosperma TaxID=252740 RepID=A0A423WE53_CYTCH|nr:hypothetical protein VSDG_02073 [Valsa sordida]
MAPRAEQSQLKRAAGSPAENEHDSSSKKPRRSERLSQQNSVKTPVNTKQQLPSPVTHLSAEESSTRFKEGTATPPESRGSQLVTRSQENYISSPPQDTQAFSQQLVDLNEPYSKDVKDEVKEGVWGYLFPLNTRYGGKCMVLRKRAACPIPDTAGDVAPKKKGRKALQKQEEDYETTKVSGVPSGGYLIGRHPECETDIVVDDPSVSNRHCLIFTENKSNDAIAIVEDLSSNGTFVNEAIIGRNHRRELKESDEIAVLDKARFIFKYPKTRQSSAFLQQYTLLEQLGKGHFAEVFLCVEKATGQRYAVKIFTKTPGMEERSKTDGLQQEIAVLMGVSHPNVLCLKDTFDEKSAVFLVLELAPEGELFNYIVLKQKLSEGETRKLFTQLFQGIKYLLYSTEFPYTLSQQIKGGRFDYPSPYWDSVGDPALDLIDSMLVVDPEKRFTVDQCLAHPWMNSSAPAVNDSTDGLVGGVGGLEIHRRGVVRERTLLSSINTVQVKQVPGNAGKKSVTVYKKNQRGVPNVEPRPFDGRDPEEFVAMGGKGDEELFAQDGTSNYNKGDIPEATPLVGNGNGEGPGPTTAATRNGQNGTKAKTAKGKAVKGKKQ